jgi:NTP pyrophosphatase (non-canonical NTP hydrolase)
LGAIYYYLLTGRPPFHERSEHDLIEKIKSGEYIGIRKMVAGIPEEIALIVDKMLDRGATSDYANCRYLLRDFDRLDMFISDLNKVFVSEDIANDRLGIWQLLVNKIYGPVNFDRPAGDIFARLTASMGRTNSLMADLQSDASIEARDHAIGYLARSFVWVCSYANKVGVDLEQAVWQKYPDACPYCMACHDDRSKCSKATKGPIDIWRLRDLANARIPKRPRRLRDWEKMFTKIYPKTSAIGIEYLSKKIIEEVGEVGREFPKRIKRRNLLRETGIDSFGFEIADVFAWTCQASVALRAKATPDDVSLLATAASNCLRYDICPFCRNGICTCDPEEETETKMSGYRYLEYKAQV